MKIRDVVTHRVLFSHHVISCTAKARKKKREEERAEKK